MPNDNALSQMLQSAIPAMNAPWEALATPRLVAAVNDAGGFGVLPCGLKTPDVIKKEIEEVRRLTSRPFGVSLVVRRDVTEISPEGQAFIEALHPIREALHLPNPTPRFVNFDEQFEAVLNSAVTHVVFTSGGPREIYAERLEAAGILFGGIAASPKDAKALIASGASFLIARGFEAGGPVESFETPYPAAPTSLAVLLGVLTRIAKDMPVIAFGAISNAREIRAYETLGASGFMLGSALSFATESGLPASFRRALAYSDETSTVLTRAFTGEVGRYLKNLLSRTMDDAGIPYPAFPETTFLTADIARFAIENERADLAAIAAEPNAYLAQNASTRDILAKLFSN